MQKPSMPAVLSPSRRVPADSLGHAVCACCTLSATRSSFEVSRLPPNSPWRAPRYARLLRALDPMGTGAAFSGPEDMERGTRAGHAVSMGPHSPVTLASTQSMQRTPRVEHSPSDGPTLLSPPPKRNPHLSWGLSASPSPSGHGGPHPGTLHSHSTGQLRREAGSGRLFAEEAPQAAARGRGLESRAWASVTAQVAGVPTSPNSRAALARSTPKPRVAVPYNGEAAAATTPLRGGASRTKPTDGTVGAGVLQGSVKASPIIKVPTVLVDDEGEDAEVQQLGKRASPAHAHTAATSGRRSRCAPSSSPAGARVRDGDDVAGSPTSIPDELRGAFTATAALSAALLHDASVAHAEGRGPGAASVSLLADDDEEQPAERPRTSGESGRDRDTGDGEVSTGRPMETAEPLSDAQDTSVMDEQDSPPRAARPTPMSTPLDAHRAQQLSPLTVVDCSGPSSQSPAHGHNDRHGRHGSLASRRGAPKVRELQLDDSNKDTPRTARSRRPGTAAHSSRRERGGGQRLANGDEREQNAATAAAAALRNKVRRDSAAVGSSHAKARPKTAGAKLRRDKRGYVRVEQWDARAAGPVIGGKAGGPAWPGGVTVRASPRFSGAATAVRGAASRGRPSRSSLVNGDASSRREAQCHRDPGAHSPPPTLRSAASRSTRASGPGARQTSVPALKAGVEWSPTFSFGELQFRTHNSMEFGRAAVRDPAKLRAQQAEVLRHSLHARAARW